MSKIKPGDLVVLVPDKYGNWQFHPPSTYFKDINRVYEVLGNDKLRPHYVKLKVPTEVTLCGYWWFSPNNCKVVSLPIDEDDIWE